MKNLRAGNIAVLCCVAIAASGAMSAAGASAPRARKPRAACVALVDVTAPAGTPVNVESYHVQLQKFFDQCVADHALMDVLPLLDGAGAVSKQFPSVASESLADIGRCRSLLKQARDEGDADKTKQAQTCVTGVKAANGGIEGFIANLLPKNVDKKLTTTEILVPLLDAAGILSDSGARRKHLLVLSPGFQTAGTQFNFNLNGGITPDSAAALVAKAQSAGSIANLKGVDVDFASLTDLDRQIDESYINGTRAFWTAYLTAAGIPNPTGAFPRVYTAANYQR